MVISLSTADPRIADWLTSLATFAVASASLKVMFLRLVAKPLTDLCTALGCSFSGAKPRSPILISWFGFLEAPSTCLRPGMRGWLI